MEEKFIQWFLKEIPILTEKGIITAQIAHSLNEYYINKLEELEKPEKTEVKLQSSQTKELDPAFTELTPSIPAKSVKNVTAEKNSIKTPAKKRQKLSVSVILTVIASVLISAGIISLIAYNWAAIPRMVKAFTAILLLTGTQTAGSILLIKKKADITKIRESYSLFWALLFGSMLAFVSQIFKFSGNTSSFLLVWAISSIIITWLFSAHTTFYLSLLFTIIFAITSWASPSAILIYPLCAALYFPARKNKWKVIPLLIISFLFFVFRLNEMFITQNIKYMILIFSIASIGFILLKKQDKDIPYNYFGMVIIFIAALISIYAGNLYSSWKPDLSAIKIAELSLIGFIALGFYTEGALIPLVGKIRRKEKFSPDNLIYLIPLILGLNSLFSKQNELLLTAQLDEWYRIFLSPFSLMVIYSMAMFVIYSIKKNHLAWAFLAILILQAVKINGITPSLHYVFVLLTLFVPYVILWQNDFSDKKETPAILITTRIISAILFFIPAFMSAPLQNSFFELSKKPVPGFLCYIPVGVFGIALIIQYARKESKSFLKNLDIIINLIFALISFAFAKETCKAVAELTIKIFAAINFIYYTIIAIKKERYACLFNTLLATTYFFMILMTPEHGRSALYFMCSIVFFATGCFLWKNNFSSTPEIKNCLIIVRVAAVLILFITILMARNTESVLYAEPAIDLFTFSAFTPIILFGLVMFATLAKKSIKTFLLNIDIVANLVITTIIISIAYLSNKATILLLLEIVTAINLITSCIYIIKSGKYEYAFYALFAIIYFVISFISTEFSTTILYLATSVILFISGTFLWKDNFEINENSRSTLFITRIIAAGFLLATTILSRDSGLILYNNSGIERYVLICFTPAAFFGLSLYICFARKNIKAFLMNLDIIINLVFSTVIFAIAWLCRENVIQLISEILIIINLIPACIYLLKNRKAEYIFYPIISILYYFITFISFSNANTTAGVFFIISILAVIIHYYAQTKNNSSLKNISAILTAFLLFYETSLRHSIEEDQNYIAKDFYIISCMIIMGAVVLYCMFRLIKKRQLFNPAVFLTPALVIALTFIADKYSVLLTFPLILLFCVYYFYLAYKNDSLKTANLSSIYFGLMLMIRFFSSGYGLSIQGITLISMGALILIMNILMTKRREKNV